ncbi:Stk1 family PASTA domain-containing Ser/Thr kinase [Desulfitibacter alkalitolerans]|uniref:Stk1 family PASTA domain-containing Ser/Thr kinase n=1 Tax=Desulfitibacter alkalitolerans TaxID=264641 RepID=UPI00047F76C2|nr:Stk1 family PASTA domain-containing Ser/Thr kinase [Desulfitibacter alkalitolerans]
MVDRVLGNRYKLLTKLGGGGMAEVYKGLDTLLDRQVTIKILREQYASDEEFVKKFRREAQAVARLSHPNIVSIYDVGIEKEIQYLVMEYVEGINLKEYISKHAPLSQDKIVNIGIQICDALDHAHSNQIVHRDIKPHNILITNTGKVKVTDFGIARAVTEATVTYTGEFMGSVHYLSPEQAKGDITDYKSDLYSAGVVLYEMVTGHIPYEGESAITIALKHIQDSPKKPTEIDPSINPNLEFIILRAMERDKDRRFSSAGEMKSYLEKLSDNHVFTDMERRKHPSNITKNKKRLKPVGWILIGLLVIGLLVGGFFAVQELIKVDEIRVPDVIEMSLEEAGRILEKEGLKVELGGERFHSSIPKNHVIDQNPKPDSIVRKGRLVRLEISMGPRQVEVPDVIGDNIRTARIRIENANLTVDEQIEEVFSEEHPVGRVIGQSPLGGVMQDMGAGVSLVVSKGPRLENIPMPDLRGLALAEAENTLREKRLNLGIISYQDSDQYFTGQVVSQDITPGNTILQGSTVNLVVSRGPGPRAQTATVTMTVSNDGQEHVIRIVVEDLKGIREEYLRRHQPGDYIKTVVQFYGHGVVKIYQDDVLIHERPVPS